MLRALAFLTPLGRASTPTPRTMDWFPLIGAVIGVAVGYVWWAAEKAWPAAVAAALALAADAALTGCLHLDGLADSADGLLPPMDRARRLTVMRDPAIGAFGAVTLGIVLLLRFGVLATTAAAPLVVAGLWCGSRTAMAVIARVLPYARGAGGGLASAFVVGGGAARLRWIVPMLAGAALAVVLALLGKGVHGVVAVVVGAAGAAAVALFARARIGGFTGDVLGAAGVVGETVGLLALAAR